jgi:hypothetical protein
MKSACRATRESCVQGRQGDATCDSRRKYMARAYAPSLIGNLCPKLVMDNSLLPMKRGFRTPTNCRTHPEPGRINRQRLLRVSRHAIRPVRHSEYLGYSQPCLEEWRRSCGQTYWIGIPQGYWWAEKSQRFHAGFLDKFACARSLSVTAVT